MPRGGARDENCSLVKRLLLAKEVLYIVKVHNGEFTEIDYDNVLLVGSAERELAGAKKKMKKEKRVQPMSFFSATHGHLGCGPRCHVCMRKRGNKKPLSGEINHKERKRGFRWRLDACTWDVRNLEGEKYAFIRPFEAILGSTWAPRIPPPRPET